MTEWELARVRGERRLAGFTEASAESVGAATHVEAGANAAVLTRLLALDWLWRRRTGCC